MKSLPCGGKWRRALAALTLVPVLTVSSGVDASVDVEDSSARSVIKSQDFGSTEMSAPAAGKESSAESGRLLILVFKQGVPLADVPIEGDFGVFRTSEDGPVSLEHPAGEVDVRLPLQGVGTRARLLARQETQLIVNLVSEAATFDLSLPFSEENSQAMPGLSDEVRGQSVTVKVSDAASGRPLAGAAVRVAGYKGFVTTDAEGRVSLRLPAGEKEILVSAERYMLLTKSVSVEPAQMEPLELSLRSAEGELEEVLVLAPQNRGSVSALVEVRRRSSAVSEVLGSEQMSRQGDSDAAASLRRVTGLTLMGGKYVYVRGLGERYSSVRLNGLLIPSPEPARRVVPLDLFPTSVLESVVVQKSYSADLPGEFGGGLIQLKTRRLPEKSFARFSMSADFSETAEGLSSSGGGTDWIGRDSGVREMPSSIRQAFRSGRRLVESAESASGGYTSEELQSLGRSLSNDYAVSEGVAPPSPGFSLALGNRWGFEAFSLGASGTLLSGSSVDVVEQSSSKFNVGAEDALEVSETAVTEKTEIERKFGASLDVGADFGRRHGLSVGALYLMNSSDTTLVKNYRQPSASVDGYRRTSLEWVERELFSLQLIGRHGWALPWSSEDLQLDWRIGRSTAARNAPDRREYVYYLRNQKFELNTDTTGNRRVFEELADRGSEIAMDVAIPLQVAVLEGAKLKIGGSRQERDRAADTYRLHLRNRFPLGQTPDLSAPPEDVFVEANRRPDGWVLTNLTESADSYTGRQNTEAAYLISEMELTKTWSLSLGARAESSFQEVRTFYYFDPGKPTSLGGMRTYDVLPAHSLTWKPSERVRARWAYSETVARPDFRELSTVPFIESETDYEAVGNSRLRGTVIRNLDHRWEYYFNPDEYASVGVFSKVFDSPIEETFEPSPNLRKTYENAERADNRGLELEARVGLRRLGRAFRRWTHLVNLSLIDSRITLSESGQGLQTSSQRPLQGQSPYVLNLQLQYDRPVEGATATILYNVIGPRITEVGTAGRPDVYEQPFQQLDLTASKKMRSGLSLGLRAKNLLDPELRATQGDEVVRNLRRGRSVSLSLSMAM